VSASAAGRHRAVGRLNPFRSLSAAAARSARPAVTATASVAAAGGMVAALSGPANAAPAAPQAPAAESVILSGTSTTRVTYGMQVVNATPAAIATKSTFTTVAVANRVRPAAQSTTAARAATTTPTRTSLAATYAAPAPKPATVNRPATGGVLGIAAGLSGIPYVWGGTSTGGFDCSGYTQYVFRQAGVSLPRTAGAQRAATAYVSNPVPGDLVFFGTYHVGIYAGNGMMYDAPSSGGTTGLHRIWSSAVTYGRA